VRLTHGYKVINYLLSHPQIDRYSNTDFSLAGMAIGAVIQRDSPYDCVVFTKKYNGQEMTLAKLPEGAVIGTSSLRRVAQLKRAYPKLKVRLACIDVSDAQTAKT